MVIICTLELCWHTAGMIAVFFLKKGSSEVMLTWIVGSSNDVSIVHCKKTIFLMSAVFVIIFRDIYSLSN